MPKAEYWENKECKTCKFVICEECRILPPMTKRTYSKLWDYPRVTFKDIAGRLIAQRACSKYQEKI